MMTMNFNNKSLQLIIIIIIIIIIIVIIAKIIIILIIRIIILLITFPRFCLDNDLHFPYFTDETGKPIIQFLQVVILQHWNWPIQI